MQTFVAHYRSLNASSERAKGLFEFESSSRLGSKANASDARMKMLELFGNDALSWTIEKIEHAPAKKQGSQSDGQLELDFRDPVKKRRRRRSTERGVV